MLSIIRASKDLMDEVRECINSNYELYKPICEEKDLNEHMVDEEWALRNFKIREYYLARDSGNFIGTCSYQNLDEKFAYIGYFYIKKGFQKKGFGHGLMNFLEMRAKQDNISKIVLFANGNAKWALNFYKRLGFEIIYTEKKDIFSIENGIMVPYYEENSYLLQKLI